MNDFIHFWMTVVPTVIFLKRFDEHSCAFTVTNRRAKKDFFAGWYLDELVAAIVILKLPAWHN